MYLFDNLDFFENLWGICSGGPCEKREKEMGNSGKIFPLFPILHVIAPDRLDICER